MDFGDILDKWDQNTAKPCGAKKIRNEERKAAAEADSPGKSVPESPRANPMDVWLRRYGITDKDTRSEASGGSESPAERRRRLHAMRPEATVDLHGLTRDEAWHRLEAFFTECIRQGLQKVLVIHGKGNHSEDNPVLKETVRLFLERNTHAGESGHSGKDSGGSGSTWVILK